MIEEEKITQIFRAADLADMVQIGLILAVAACLIFIIHKIVPRLSERMQGQVRLYFLASIPLLRMAIFLFALLLVVPLIVEPSLQNMVAIMGAIGLALGFALKDYTSSLIAGIVVLVEMPFRNGDWVEINGTYGEVTNVGLRTLRIVTPDDTIVYIPHLKFWTEPIFNANNGGPSLQCVVDFYLHPDHDGHRIRSVLYDVAMSSPYVQLDKPVIVVAQENNWATHYRIRAYPIDPRQQFRFMSDLTMRGKEALQRLGVRYPSAPAALQG